MKGYWISLKVRFHLFAKSLIINYWQILMNSITKHILITEVKHTIQYPDIFQLPYFL